MSTLKEKETVAACLDEEVARTAKENGFTNVFFAKKNTQGTYEECVLVAEYMTFLKFRVVCVV